MTMSTEELITGVPKILSIVAPLTALTHYMISLLISGTIFFLYELFPVANQPLFGSISS